MTRKRAWECGATAVVLLALAVPAGAQSSNLLNALEVRRLVDGDQPADHIGLRDHFLALAVRYDNEARREDARARALPGNPNHPAPGHGLQAAERAKQLRLSAALVRELAVYHERVAAGVPAVAPEGAGRFHNGEGAPVPTDRDVRALAAMARTRADHRAMAEYYASVAGGHRAQADRYALRARMYRAVPNDRLGGGNPALHFDRLTVVERNAARRADARALVHSQLADLIGTE